MLKYIPRPIRKKLLILRALLTRAMTLGVKGVVQDDEGRVLLVKHTYVDGWHLPGGGVERGETLAETVIKELQEEVSIEVTSRPRHFHTYYNTRMTRLDHVAVFICDEWKSLGKWEPNREIAEMGFFSLDALPEGTMSYTRDTLNEIFDGQAVRDNW